MSNQQPDRTIYAFRIRPGLRFGAGCVLVVLAWYSLRLAFLVPHDGTAVMLMLQAAAYLVCAAFVMTNVGKILRAYLGTWR